MKALLCCLLFLPILTAQASAKAYFQSKQEMIRKADVIAVITITEVQEVTEMDRIQDYRKSGQAKLEMLIKGQIADQFTILGDETFICAQCPIAKGRYLAFLSKQGDQWDGTNWHLSLRPITGDQVEWYANNDDRHDMKPADLKATVAEIRAILATKPDEENKP